jgi:hypothetical protein
MRSASPESPNWALITLKPSRSYDGVAERQLSSRSICYPVTASPQHIALSTVELVGRERQSFERGIGTLDDTPILDIRHLADE